MYSLFFDRATKASVADNPMTRPTARAVALLGVLTVAAATLTAWSAATSPIFVRPTELAVARATLVAAYALAGIYVWLRRPEERFGPLMVLLGLTFALTSPLASGDPTWHTIGRLANAGWVGFYLFAFLAFPAGRLGTRAERAIVYGYLAVAAVGWPLIALTAAKVPSAGVFTACGDRCPDNGLRVFDLSSGVPSRIVLLATAVAALAAIVVLARKAASPLRVERYTVGPVLLAAIVVMVGYVVYTLHPATGRWVDLNLVISGAAALFTPIAFVIGPRRGEYYVSRSLWRALTGIDYTSLSSTRVEQLCRQALGDASLRLAVATPAGGSLRDLSGAAITPGGNVVLTRVDVRDGRYVVLHDPSLAYGYRGLVRRVAELALTLLDYGRLFGETLMSRRRLAHSEGVERARLERDLHDGAQQYLLSLQMKLADIARVVAGSRLESSLRDVSNEAARASDEIRRIGHGIYPELLLQSGLAAALGEVPAPPRFVIRIQDDGVGRLPEATERAAYFAIVEAIQNAAKHSGGTGVDVVLTPEDDLVRVVVTDDGHGFDVDAVEGSGGLTAIRDRVSSIGGSTTVRAGSGAVVELTFPRGYPAT
jgi:signal transduction histidine kinase